MAGSHPDWELHRDTILRTLPWKGFNEAMGLRHRGRPGSRGCRGPSPSVPVKGSRPVLPVFLHLDP